MERSGSATVSAVTSTVTWPLLLLLLRRKTPIPSSPSPVPPPLSPWNILWPDLVLGPLSPAFRWTFFYVVDLLPYLLFAPTSILVMCECARVHICEKVCLSVCEKERCVCVCEKEMCICVSVCVSVFVCSTDI